MSHQLSLAVNCGSSVVFGQPSERTTRLQNMQCAAPVAPLELCRPDAATVPSISGEHL
jgi:hypothetical protein